MLLNVDILISVRELLANLDLLTQQYTLWLDSMHFNISVYFAQRWVPDVNESCLLFCN